MRKFFQRPQARQSAPEPTEVSRPSPPPDIRPMRVGADNNKLAAPEFADTVVSELSDLEAHALCAREGIPVFWRREGHRRTD
ncbi:hypothetical protein WKW79_35335 [Variovorax robiniae]|uniref:Uncharacterized protein n=1 Tax=Variovorax robiniae TaxID=1836199 RepID=A0ABU8XLB6_9BURK